MQSSRIISMLEPPYVFANQPPMPDLFVTCPNFLLSSLPADMRRNALARFFTEEQLAALALTSYALYRETVSPVIWMQKIIDLGVEERLLQEVNKTGVLINYQKIYRLLTFALHHSVGRHGR